MSILIRLTRACLYSSGPEDHIDDVDHRSEAGGAFALSWLAVAAVHAVGARVGLGSSE